MKNQIINEIMKTNRKKCFVKITLVTYIFIMITAIFPYYSKFVDYIDEEFLKYMYIGLGVLLIIFIMSFLTSCSKKNYLYKKSIAFKGQKFYSIISMYKYLKTLPYFVSLNRTRVAVEENEEDGKTTNINKNVFHDFYDTLSFEDLTLTKIANDFATFSKSQGLEIDKETAVGFFAAIASSKLIFITHEDFSLLYKLIYNASLFLCADTCYIDFNNINTTDDLLYYQNGYSDFSYCLLSNKDSRRFTFNVFSNVYLEKFINECSFLIDFANNYGEDYVLKIRNLNTYDAFMDLVISKRTCNFIVADKNTPINDLPKELLSSSINYLPRNMKFINDFQAEFKNYAVPYSWFEEAVKEALEENLISENMWKRIDEVENVLKENGYQFNNKDWMLFEKFTSVYNCLTNNEEAAVDNLLLYKIIPYMNTVKKDYKDSSLYLIIETIFGSENITRSNELLKKLKK